MFLAPSVVSFFLFFTFSAKAFDDEFGEWLNQVRNDAESDEQTFKWNSLSDDDIKSFGIFDREFLEAYERNVNKYGEEGTSRERGTVEEEGLAENGHNEQQQQIGVVGNAFDGNGISNDCPSAFIGAEIGQEQTNGNIMMQNNGKERMLEQYKQLKTANPTLREFEVAKMLKISDRGLERLKKEFGVTKSRTLTRYDSGFKFQKMCQYYQLKETNPDLTDICLAAKLGISPRSLSRWKMTGLTELWHAKCGSKRALRKYGTEEKRQKISEYFQLKGQNPKLRAYELAKVLNISDRTLCRWKAQFGGGREKERMNE